MSRCFPYPPPGYSRNGATYEALIESIKLQKENDNAKAERKKEKRAKKEKKEKGKRKDEGKAKAKLQKNPNEYQHDAHKVLKGLVDFKEAHNKKTEPTIEQLERSDLTEEHGQPIISHKPSYSSDSTQNSSKRKRDDILPDGSSGHGKPIKIRLLKKRRPDSNKEALCSNSGRIDSQGLSGADVRLSTWNLSLSGNNGPSLVSINKYSGVPPTSGRENNAAHGIPFSQTKSTTNFGRPGIKDNEPRGLQYGRQQLVPDYALKQETRTPILSKTEVSVPSRLIKSDVEGLHSSRRHAIPSHGRLIESYTEHQMATPSSIMPLVPSVSRKIDVQGYRTGIEQSTQCSETLVLPSNHLTHGVPNSDLSKTKSSVMGKRLIKEIDDGGLTGLEKKKDLIGDAAVAGTSNGQKGGVSRSEKKMRKKHAKYEKLVGSWAPPVLQAPLLEADDEDWLSRSGRTARCLSRTDVEMCRDSAASSLWQPCARFLPDADVHALPYTVLF